MKPTKFTSNKYHHGALKEALLEVALELLSRDGLHALSVRSIAFEAGVSHSAPYSHFKNKKEILKSLVEFGYEKLAKEFEEIQADDRGSNDLIVEYGSTYIKFALENAELYKLMFGKLDIESGRHSSALELRRNQKKNTYKRAFMILNEAIEKNCQSTIEAKHQAAGAWALVHGISSLIIEGHLKIPKSSNLKDLLKSMMLRN